MKHKSIYAWRKPGGRLKARPYMSFIAIAVGWPKCNTRACRTLAGAWWRKDERETSLGAAGKSVPIAFGTTMGMKDT